MFIAWCRYTSAATLSSFTLNVTISASNSITVTGGGYSFSWTETRLATGSAGLLSAGVGTYANFAVTTGCDVGGIQCANAYSYHKCTFSCATGYVPTSGSTTRTCMGGVWSGSMLQCTISTLTGGNR